MKIIITLMLINIAFALAMFLRAPRKECDTAEYIINAFYVKYAESCSQINSPHYVALNFV